MTDHYETPVKSNARRKAKSLGLDLANIQTLVKAGKKFYRLPLVEGDRLRATPTTKQPAKVRVDRKARVKKAAGGTVDALKAATSKPRKFKDPDKAPRVTGANFDMVATMLREPGGAAISAVCKATKWLPHTARARISVNVSKLLARGEVIQRVRKDGESHYAIVKSSQKELPGV